MRVGVIDVQDMELHLDETAYSGAADVTKTEGHDKVLGRYQTKYLSKTIMLRRSSEVTH